MDHELRILNITAKDRHIAFLIFGFLLSCYLFTFTGVLESSDGMAMFATAESMVRRGEIDSNQLLWMGLQQGSFGPDGELYSRKGLGMPLLVLPLIWLAQQWPAIGLVQAAMLLNPLLLAWSGGLLFRTGRRFGWSRAAALMVALSFGLATLAWPYAQTFFSDPMSAWGLVGAFYCMVGFRQTGRKRYLLMGGLSWGLAYLSRSINLITLPIYLIALLNIIMRYARPGRGTPLHAVWPVLMRNWRPFASFMIPVVAAGLASLWWNWVRYGSMWQSGYVESESFSADWIMGIYGLLVGPGRGLLWYSPVLLLAIPGAWLLWQRRPWAVAMCVALVGVYVLVYGKWYMWHGGYSWGPRFMVVTLPFLTLLTGPVFQWLFTGETAGQHGWPPSWLNRVAAVGVAFLILISVGVQWLGMLAPFSMVQNWLAETVPPLFAPETFTQWRYSPLVLQWQYLAQNNVPFAWWRPEWNGGAQIHWAGLAAPIIGIVAGVWFLGRNLSNTGEASNTGETSEERTDATSWLFALLLGLIVLAILVQTRTNTTSLTPTPYDNMVRVAQRIEQLEQRSDAILLLEPEQTQRFANLYHGHLPTYGLFGQTQLDEANQQWLARLRAEYRRLWVVPDSTLPDASGWERPLRTDDYLLWESRAADDTGQRLALYALAPAQTLEERGLGAVFGDLSDVGSTITPENGRIRLNGYAFTQQTQPNGELLLTLRWESLQPVANNYHVFVHILNEANDKVDQRDGQPVQWMRPTSSWRPGELIIDHYGLLLPADFPPGNYKISIGLYDPVSGQRLPVNGGTSEYAIELGPVQVQPR